VIDNDLAAVVIDIAIMITLFDDDRVAIPMIVAVANHFTLADDIAITMALADGHADRTHTHANFIRNCRQRGSEQRGGRYNSKT
jgi:hypothetical protein